MTHFQKLLVAALSALSVVAAGSATALAHADHRILQFSSMTPVTGAAVGAVNERGLVGGGKAWAITSGSGSVSRDGHVMVSVTGLVIPEFGNVNPAKQFKAIVSCITQHHGSSTSAPHCSMRAPPGTRPSMTRSCCRATAGTHLFS
jgi:hypothetical protein